MAVGEKKRPRQELSVRVCPRTRTRGVEVPTCVGEQHTDDDDCADDAAVGDEEGALHHVKPLVAVHPVTHRRS